jgi:hypothetical protein
MKEKLYKFIDNYGQETIIQDLNKATNEIKPFEQPQTNYEVNTVPLPVIPLMTKFEVYKQEILETRTIKEIEAVMRKVKNDLLSVREKQTLEAIAKEHSKDFYND